MRPTSIVSLVIGVLGGLAGVALTVLVFLDGDGGKPWHYWIAPFLAIGFGGLLLTLVAGYLAKVGRLELKGRPRGD